MTALQVVWTPDDYRELAELAAEHAEPCRHALTLNGQRYPCEHTTPHHTHVNTAIPAQWWVAEGETR